MPVPGESLQIEIALKDHATLEQVQAALGRVFLLNRDGEPEDSLSKSWLCEAGSSNCDAIEQIGPGVTAPKLMYSPEPDFSERARKAKYQGTVVMNIVLNKAGRVLRTRVTRRLGMDLDEQAIGKISTWKFNPATRNGQPVVVALSVEVSFNLN
jgi:TonB family protein